MLHRHVHLRYGLFERYARLEPAYNFEIVVVPVLVFLLGKLFGNPEGNLGAWKMEMRGHHTDDEVRPVVQNHLSSQHSGVAGELCLPQLVAKQQRSRRAFALVQRCENPSQQRLRAQQWDYARSDGGIQNPLWIALPYQIDRARQKRPHGFE